MDLEAYRRRSREIWEAMAPGWERWTAQLEKDATPLRKWMIRELAARPGDTVLELSAGAGDTGFEVAPTLGREGLLISSDFAADMVEVARRRGGALGLENVDYRVIDAERIDLGDDSVDGVLCRWGYMLMADPAQALAETRRVLRPGGRLVLSVWGPPDRNPWFAAIARTLVEHGHMPAPEPDAPGVFSMASEERTRSLLERAGFDSIEAEEISFDLVFPDLDAYTSCTLNAAGAIAGVLRRLSEDELGRVRERLREAFEPYVSRRGYDLPGITLNAVAS